MPGFLNMRAMAVSGSNAYLANVDLNDPSPIIHCRIEPTGTLTGCADSEATGFLEEPHGLTVHGSTLYIANARNPIVRKCEIKADGSLDACTNAGFPDTLAIAARDLRMVGTTAYILHYNENLVSRCEVQTNGSLLGCANAGAADLNHPKGFAINGRYMYVANSGDEDQAGNVVRCIVDDSGLLSDCIDAGVPGLFSPTQVAIRGSMVYITGADHTASLIRCTASASNGLLAACTSISSEPRSLHSIVLK